jgi:hypothetical protein
MNSDFLERSLKFCWLTDFLDFLEISQDFCQTVDTLLLEFLERHLPLESKRFTERSQIFGSKS